MRGRPRLISEECALRLFPPIPLPLHATMNRGGAVSHGKYETVYAPRTSASLERVNMNKA